MNRHRARVRLVAKLAVLLLLMGCNRGPKRHHVSGTILFNGKPVPMGEIYFDPDVSKGHDGPQGFARIKDGRYDTREIEKPVSSGPHVARIFGFDGKPLPEQPLGRPIFPEYSAPAPIADQGDATLNFDVPGKGKTP